MQAGAMLTLPPVLGMINGQAESGQKAWSKLVASEMREYVRNHPDDFHFGGKVVEGEEQEDDDNDEGEGSGEGGALSLSVSSFREITDLFFLRSYIYSCRNPQRLRNGNPRMDPRGRGTRSLSYRTRTFPLTPLLELSSLILRAFLSTSMTISIEHISL